MPLDLSSQIAIHHMNRERGVSRGASYAKAHGDGKSDERKLVISGDKLESQLKERKPIREIFSIWLLSRDYKKGDPIIYHLNWDYFRNEWECH